MPASFFCVSGCRGWESGCRDAGRNLGISGCRAVFGISGGGRVGAAMRASVWRGKEGARSEDCRVLGRLLGTRRIAGRSEGGRGACGSLCVFRARLVNAWAGSCRELPEGPDCWLRIAGGAGAGCRELGRWEEGRLRVGGRGMLGGDLFGRNLVGCREGAAHAACCRLFGSRVEAGRGCSGLCRELKPRESGI